MQQHATRTDLRHYTTAEDRPLLDVICENGVNRNNIFWPMAQAPFETVHPLVGQSENQVFSKLRKMPAWRDQSSEEQD